MSASEGYNALNFPACRKDHNAKWAAEDTQERSNERNERDAALLARELQLLGVEPDPPRESDR